MLLLSYTFKHKILPSSCFIVPPSPSININSEPLHLNSEESSKNHYTHCTLARNRPARLPRQHMQNAYRIHQPYLLQRCFFCSYVAASATRVILCSFHSVDNVQSVLFASAGTLATHCDQSVSVMDFFDRTDKIPCSDIIRCTQVTVIPLPRCKCT